MKKFKDNAMKQLALLGKSMLIPIVILPLIGMIGSIFDPTILNVPVIYNVRDVLFENMDMLFVLGTAVAYSKGKDKTFVLVAAVMGFLMFKSNVKMLNEAVDMGVFGGIIFGIVSAVVYNYSREWKISPIFSFFAGDKLAIVLIPLIVIPFSMLMATIWVYPQSWLETLSIWIAGSGLFGIFLFAVLQRLLIPTGLHHVLNTYFMFEMGSYTSQTGEVAKGIIARFFAGDVEAGYYTAGFAVMFFFCLPAICLAIYHTARPENKLETKSAMASGALTSVLAGISEPIEFSFMFASPKLYFIYANLVGLASVVLAMLKVSNLGVQRLIEFVFLYPMGKNVWVTIPVGLIFGVMTYYIFKFIIIRDDVETPGREKVEAQGVSKVEQDTLLEEILGEHSEHQIIAKAILDAIGTSENIVTIESCMTRLRIEVLDGQKVDDEKVRNAGGKALIRTTDTDIQIVIGTDVSFIYKEMEKQL